MAGFLGGWVRSPLWVGRSVAGQLAGMKTVAVVGDSHYSRLRQ
ncbi:MAG: hypothetical protein ACRC8Y_23205 [Chroococcales cyanobacterium]